MDPTCLLFIFACLICPSALDLPFGSNMCISARSDVILPSEMTPCVCWFPAYDVSTRLFPNVFTTMWPLIILLFCLLCTYLIRDMTTLRRAGTP